MYDCDILMLIDGLGESWAKFELRLLTRPQSSNLWLREQTVTSWDSDEWLWDAEEIRWIIVPEDGVQGYANPAYPYNTECCILVGSRIHNTIRVPQQMLQLLPEHKEGHVIQQID